LESYLGRKLLDNIYVDNLFMEASTVDEAKELVPQSKAIFADAKMNAREYVSNSAAVCEDLPDEDRLDPSQAKALGLRWDVQSDVLIIPYHFTGGDPVTRRRVIKETGATWDPLGFVAPTLLKAKLLFQSLWGTGHSRMLPCLQQRGSSGGK